MNKINQDVFTTEEMAYYLGCSIQTLRQMVRENKIPSFRVGTGKMGPIRFRRKVIDLWIEEQEKASINKGINN